MLKLHTFAILCIVVFNIVHNVPFVHVVFALAYIYILYFIREIRKIIIYNSLSYKEKFSLAPPSCIAKSSYDCFR